MKCALRWSAVASLGLCLAAGLVGLGGCGSEGRLSCEPNCGPADGAGGTDADGGGQSDASDGGGGEDGGGDADAAGGGDAPGDADVGEVGTDGGADSDGGAVDDTGATDTSGDDSAGDGGSDGGADAEPAECAGPLECEPGEVCESGRCAPGPFADMLLRAQGGRLVTVAGSEVDFRGAISCCGGGYGWPLFDEAWVDRVTGRGVNFLHMRLGPFLTGANGESDWADVGGGYVTVDGKADLAQFNAAFWNRVRALVEYAGERGVWVEVDVADGWAIKHCRWGDIPGYSAWDADYNVQGEDWCTTGGSREIIGGDVHEQWVRQVVRETGRYGNVIYQDGNEVGIVGGYAPEWTLSIRNIVHDEEARRNYARHLFGTNSGNAVAMQAEGVDFIELHQQSAPDPSGCYGRPCLCNEYNPSPSFTPAEFHARFCEARALGTYFWYWRHGQTDEQMEQSLTLMQGGCD